MTPFQSFRSRLASELQRIEASILELWKKSQIDRFRNDPCSQIVFVAPPYHWKPLLVEHLASQAALNTIFQRWLKLFSLYHSRHNSDVQNEIRSASEFVNAAIELNMSWQMQPTFEENREYLSKRLDIFRRLLTCRVDDAPSLILVPDTNALLRTADPVEYRELAGAGPFTFAIVPTVLSELDDLKRSRRDQTLGSKAEKVIRMLKGFRAQGSVLEGVTVSKTITVKMIPTEPRTNDFVSWLDPMNKDDRIIATVLEIQCENPDADVLLVTLDINLQNKAEMAFLP